MKCKQARAAIQSELLRNPANFAGSGTVVFSQDERYVFRQPSDFELATMNLTIGLRRQRH